MKRPINCIHLIYIGVTIIAMVMVEAIAYAQPGREQFIKLNAIVEQIKEMKLYSYSYKLEARFPDGKKETLNGKVYSDASRKLMYNISDHYVIWYTGKWFYRAEHEEKRITILDNAKAMVDSVRSFKENDIFNNALSNEFIDSFILKYGKITGYSEQKDTLNITLSFQSGPLKQISFRYNTQSKTPVSLVMNTSYGAANDPKGISQVLTCSQYARTPEKASLDQYFVYKNGKIKLIKYKDYKLYSLL